MGNLNIPFRIFCKAQGAIPQTFESENLRDNLVPKKPDIANFEILGDIPVNLLTETPNVNILLYKID